MLASFRAHVADFHSCIRKRGAQVRCPPVRPPACQTQTAMRRRKRRGNCRNIQLFSGAAEMVAPKRTNCFFSQCQQGGGKDNILQSRELLIHDGSRRHRVHSPTPSVELQVRNCVNLALPVCVSRHYLPANLHSSVYFTMLLLHYSRRCREMVQSWS